MPPKKTHPVTLIQGAMVIIGASLYALITSFLRIAETTAAPSGFPLLEEVADIEALLRFLACRESAATDRTTTASLLRSPHTGMSEP